MEMQYLFPCYLMGWVQGGGVWACAPVSLVRDEKRNSVGQTPQMSKKRHACVRPVQQNGTIKAGRNQHLRQAAVHKLCRAGNAVWEGDTPVCMFHT